MEKSEFKEYLMNMFTSGFTTLAIAIGRETGLLEFLCNTEQPMTAMEIADGTKLKERYVREWLGCMIAANIVILDTQSAKYHVPANHKDGLMNHTALSSGLIHWARRFDMTKEVFSAGGPQESGMKVVDIGCGSANLSCAIAKLYPNSSFIGLEYADSVVERARENVRQKGVTNMTIEQGDALNLPDSWTEQFDWVFVYEVIHDLPDPRKAFSEIRRIMKDDGKCWIFEVNVHSTHAVNVGNKGAAMLYAASMFVCLPSSMCHPPSVGYGTCWGIEECEKTLTESGLKVIMKKSATDGAEYLFVCVK
ncbi:hypothetical protein CHS0354_039585 [Potamilus streckersoni]|uniref:Methyltransferase domain-containing protein n=1 Tax=Potamilus streckersoni TaxID=2493646 RepID=A0AAE0VH38_9BIVA|nr:hypothetical protein CHS0354_039585 [Potamilus streckersoni]